MKQYLTYIFIALSIFAVIVSFQFDVRWNGIVAWGLATIFLLFAAYFVKYIPEDQGQKRKNDRGQRAL